LWVHRLIISYRRCWIRVSPIGVVVRACGLEPGDRFGRGADDLGDQVGVVVAAERVVGRFDRDGAAGADHADVDALSGDDDPASAADAALDLDRFGGWLGW
jgi:hypothetical protein